MTSLKHRYVISNQAREAVSSAAILVPSQVVWTGVEPSH